jgi:magnesium transporter
MADRARKYPRRKRVHYPPGSLVYRGKERTEAAVVRILRYNPEAIIEEQYTFDASRMKPVEGQVTWIHVNGIHDVDLIGSIGNAFQMHPLLLEDILSTETLPKMEDFDNILFASLNAITYISEEEKLQTSNVSLVLLSGVILSFQEYGPDFAGVVYNRLMENKGLLRSRKEDYLFYRFIDVLVDEYKTVLDHIEDHTEELEATSIELAENSNIATIHTLRRQLNRMRRNVQPLSTIIHRLYHEPGEYFQEQTMHFLRDLLDDIEHVFQRIESARENLLNIMDINFTNISMKTNEVMRVLTIVATMFIPMTFLAGIYGMNFEFMPELGWKYAYAVFWLVMSVLAITMIVFFKRNRWL